MGRTEQGGSKTNGLLEIRAEMPTMDDSWDVEAVVQYRTYYRKEQWLIKWQGYGEDRNTWHLGAQGASAGGVGAAASRGGQASSKRLWSTTSARGAGSDLSRGLCMEVPCEGG